MPYLSKTANGKAGDSIAISLDSSSSLMRDSEEWVPGGKWEDDEERRFYEDLADLKDFVPKTVLGVEVDEEATGAKGPAVVDPKKVEEETKKLEEEMERLALKDSTIKDGDGDEEPITEATGIPTLHVFLSVNPFLAIDHSSISAELCK